MGEDLVGDRIALAVVIKSLSAATGKSNEHCELRDGGRGRNRARKAVKLENVSQGWSRTAGKLTVNVSSKPLASPAEVAEMV